MELEGQRVHELADELGYSEQELIRIINELDLGFTVSNFMTELDPYEVRELREALEDYENHRAEAEALDVDPPSDEYVSPSEVDPETSSPPSLSDIDHDDMSADGGHLPDAPDASNPSASSSNRGGESSLEDRYAPGDRIQGEIQNITDFGLFVRLEEGLNGLVHISDISWTRKIQHPGELYDQGEDIECVVIGVDANEGKVSLGIKQLEPDPWATRIPDEYEEGDIVDVTITKLADFGAFAEIEEGITGLIHVSELADRWVDDPGEIVETGEESRAEIIKVDSNEREMAFSIKNIESGGSNPSSDSDEEPDATDPPSQYGDVYKEQLGGIGDESGGGSASSAGDETSMSSVKPEIRSSESTLHETSSTVVDEDPEVAETRVPEYTVETHFEIEHGESGHSYEELFGEYLEETTRVTVEEPNLGSDYEFQNFQRFCELAAKIDSLEHITLVTRLGDDQEAKTLRTKLDHLGDSLEGAGIELELDPDEHLYDGEIRTDTGWVVLIGRGLHIYQKPENRHGIGATDLELRDCRQTKVTIFQWPEA